MWSSPCHHYHSLCWGDLGENTQRSPYSLSLTQCRAESEIFKLLVLGLESSLTYFFAVFISSVVLYSGLYGTNLVQKLHWDPQEKVSDWVKKISREQKTATLFAVTNASGHLLMHILGMGEDKWALSVEPVCSYLLKYCSEQNSCSFKRYFKLISLVGSNWTASMRCQATSLSGLCQSAIPGHYYTVTVNNEPHMPAGCSKAEFLTAARWVSGGEKGPRIQVIELPSKC